MNLDWQDSAACSSVDPELFSGDTLTTRRAAVKVCAGCPVKDVCYTHAAAVRQVEVVQAGFWWDQHGNPTSVRGADLAVIPDGTPPPPPLTCPGGHPSSRYRWVSKKCAESGCEAANVFYEHNAYLKRREKRRTQAA